MYIEDECAAGEARTCLFFFRAIEVGFLSSFYSRWGSFQIPFASTRSLFYVPFFFFFYMQYYILVWSCVVLPSLHMYSDAVCEPTKYIFIEELLRLPQYAKEKRVAEPHQNPFVYIFIFQL